MYSSLHYLIIVSQIVSLSALWANDFKKVTRSIEEMAIEYEDDKNSLLATTEGTDNMYLYEDFYEELDNRQRLEHSMNMIFFSFPSSFIRLDPETILHIFIHTKKHLIPITRALLAWDIITDGKTAAFLQGREYLAFGSLLNVVPEEDLYYANFGDRSVLRYFANHYFNLHRRKYGILAAAYRRYFGSSWYKNSSHINELGYLLCGFSSLDLKLITPETFKELNVDLLRKVEKCSVSQAKTLYNIAIHPDAYGEPYKWSSHEIGRLNTLFNCISKHDISSIQLEAVPAISNKVINSMDQKKLEYFTKQQILRLNAKARRAYILRMQLRNSLDTTQISKANGSKKSVQIVHLCNSFVILNCYVILY